MFCVGSQRVLINRRERRLEECSVSYYKITIITYLALGALIVLTTRARREVFGALSPAEIEKNPLWKAVVLYSILIPAAFLFWPIFLPGWLRKKESVLDLLQKPASQGGSGMKELFDAMNSLSEDGCDTDEIPGAEGRFGWDLSNPVPTHTTFGSTSYLARLRTEDGQEITYERIGSFDSPASEMPVDGYELRDAQGNELGVLYISPYHRRNSAASPEGLSVEQ
jgi:hypothetical protein